MVERSGQLRWRSRGRCDEGGNEMLLLILILALIWIFSWSGPRYYPAYADRYNRYPLWGGRSHILLVILAIVLILWLLGAIRF
jgi:uncharacterized membrane protein YhdT